LLGELASAYPSYTSAYDFQAQYTTYDSIACDGSKVQKTYRIDN
jgi:hypothetical protein